MEEVVRQAMIRRVKEEPFAQKMRLELIELSDGYSVVEMTFSEDMENIFGMAHGGAIFSLIDEAFETAANSHGTVAVALNMNITYTAAAARGARLRAEARELNRTPRTATYDIKVVDENRTLIALCQALVYRKKKRLPFLE
ncbi:MAG: hotdog fold thioesterase [Thermodesulfobacteriota bacterium]|nr:hotdog fold thioesterase [Thermodesulfobacteriota bacterium]